MQFKRQRQSWGLAKKFLAFAPQFVENHVASFPDAACVKASIKRRHQNPARLNSAFRLARLRSL
jgi:hypothetical protein